MTVTRILANDECQSEWRRFYDRDRQGDWKTFETRGNPDGDGLGTLWLATYGYEDDDQEELEF